MSLDLPDLAAGVATIPVPVSEDAHLLIRMRLDGYGYREHRALLEATIARRDRLPAVLSARLADWDLTRRELPIPISERTLARTSIPLMVMVGAAIRRAVEGRQQRDDLAAWIFHRGEWGAIPEWYAVFKSAETARAQPWIMAGLPETEGNYLWHSWALSARAAEGMAEEQRSRVSESRRGRH